MPWRASVPTSRSRDAAAADDDRLLGVALHEQVDPHVQQRRPALLGVARPLARHHLVDDHGEGVRQLVAHALEGRLADELGDHDGLRLVGQLAVRVQVGALGQVRDEHRLQLLDLVPVLGGDGHDVGPLAVHGPASWSTERRCCMSVSRGTRSAFVTTATTGTFRRPGISSASCAAM